MARYRIIYIDEEENDRVNYSEMLECDQLNVVAIHPTVVEIDLINYIIDEKYDAVIIDHRLMGTDPTIKYYGAEVVQQIQEMKDRFPAFILTNNKDEDDVNELIEDLFIFTKEELRNNREYVQGKIIGTIKHYNKVNLELEKRLAELIEKRDGGEELDESDLQELRDLNYEIERRLNRKEIIPDVLKDSESLKALNKVIQDAQDYLNQIK